MAQRGPADPNDLIAGLSQLGDLRVWSVIITVFGDAAMPRGGVVPAQALSAITDRFGIRPEALRVALFRLAKDGWISRRKTGRNSFYSLTDTGRAEFLPATRRIYAKAPALAPPWRLAALPPAPEGRRAALQNALRAAGYLALSPGLFLGHGGCAAPPEQAVRADDTRLALPGWARDALAPPALQRDYARLEAALLTVDRGAATGSGLPPLDAAALRIMLVHQWRRLLLRHADLPAELLPADWRGERCRALVLSLHDRLSPQADTWLDAAIGPRG